MHYNLTETGNRIRELREREKMTQTDLADVISCTLGHVGRCERGVEGFSIDNLLQIAEYFDVSIDYLVAGKESLMPTSPSLTTKDEQLSGLKMNRMAPHGRRL
ncbi:MAG: helix-turn-helix domain-containing protein [Solobacterium sp.]|jgi:transcriptional regulator with XRE-family HTH domain|nr:helix-turn-helix domain-containing protein [Solobacterium sp.]